MRDIASPLDGFASPFGPVRRSLRAMLFGQNEPGFTFEPWDITTLYQDRAGTTPVTAAGQSVGLRLDKSKGLWLGPELVTNGDFSAGATGWSSTNSTLSVVSGALQMSAQSASPATTVQTISGMTVGRTYEVSATYWQGGTGGTAARISFFGSATANNSTATPVTVTLRIVATLTSASISLQSFGTVNTLSYFDNVSVRELAGNHEVAINDAARGIYGWMPKTGRRNLLVATDTLATQSVTVTAAAHTLAFTGTGTVVLSGAYVGTLIGTGASDRGTLTFTPIAASLTLTVTGSVTLAQLQLGSVDTAYQRVVSNYDITEAGVPSCYYVLANGVNTAYVTPTITPNTDKVQVFAGVRKNSDAASGIVVETSAEYTTNPGAFVLAAPSSAGANSYRFGSNGAPAAPGANAGTGVFAAAPNTSVLTGLGSISGDIATLRRNGALVETNTTNQGTGNYLAYPAYIYARGGTTLPFNGYDFGHAVRFGPNLDAATIARVEALIARNTPEVTL